MMKTQTKTSNNENLKTSNLESKDLDFFVARNSYNALSQFYAPKKDKSLTKTTPP